MTYDIYSDDPLEMIWAVREKIYEETKDFSVEQWNDYLLSAATRVETDVERTRQAQLNTFSR